jgi:hypothetical protein
MANKNETTKTKSEKFRNVAIGVGALLIGAEVAFG